MVIRLKKALTGQKIKSEMKRTKAKKCPQLSGREGKTMKRINETVTQDTKAERQKLYEQAKAHAARIRAFIANMDGKAEPEKKSEAEPEKKSEATKPKRPAKKKAVSPEAPEVKAPAAQAGPALVLAPSPTSQISLML